MEDLLTGLLHNLLQVLLLGLLGLGGMAITKVADMMGLKKDAEIRAYLYDGLHSALNYSEAELRRRMDAGVVTLAAAGNARLEIARGYVQQHFADALRHFSVDAGALDRMLVARGLPLAAPVVAMAASDAVAAAAGSMRDEMTFSPATVAAAGFRIPGSAGA